MVNYACCVHLNLWLYNYSITVIGTKNGLRLFISSANEIRIGFLSKYGVKVTYNLLLRHTCLDLHQLKKCLIRMFVYRWGQMTHNIFSWNAINPGKIVLIATKRPHIF